MERQPHDLKMDRSRGVRHQFGLRTLFGLTATCAAVFAIFRWLGLEPRTSLFVAAVLGVALIGAISLVVAIGRHGMESETESAANREAHDEEANDNEADDTQASDGPVTRG